MSAEADLDVVRSVLGRCVLIARAVEDGLLTADDAVVLRQIEDVLRSVWRVSSTMAALELGAEVDAEPGYLNSNGIRIPFYFFADIPDAASLQAFVDLGASVRISEAGTLCLAGSAAMMRTVTFIADVDYCEYVPYTDADRGDMLDRVAVHTQREEPPLCRTVKEFGGSWRCDCPAEWDSSARSALDLLVMNGARRLKLDFVARGDDPIGVLETTNLALLHGGDDDESVLQASFAAQEVVLTPAELPRALADPIQVGRYIDFLVEEVNRYATAKPQKALKRALCLARVLRLSGADDRVIDLLRESPGALSSAIEARSELLARLNAEGSAMRRASVAALRTDL